MGWNEEATNVKEQEEPKTEIEFKSLGEAKNKRGLKILSYGNFSTGKTHFALSSPGPVFIIDTENGASPLAKNFPDAKILNICGLDGGDEDDLDEVKNFSKLQDAVNYLVNLPDDEVGTVIIDSITDLWTWSQAYAKTKIFKIPINQRFAQQWDWAVPTKLYLKQIMKLINKNANVIFVARQSEKYIGAGQPSGIFSPSCQKLTPYWVDVVLYHEIKFIKNEIIFYAKIEKCRQNGKIIGSVVNNPTIEKIKEMVNNDKIL